MPRLVFPNGESGPVDLTESVVLGRSVKHANVVLDDNRLSRAHCRIEPSDDGWTVIDLESQNGTFLNGRRIKQSMLKPGDVIKLGAVEVDFEDNSGPGGETVMKGVQSANLPPENADLSLEEPDAVSDDSAPAPVAPDGTVTLLAPAALVVLKGSLTERVFPLTKEVFNVGRKRHNDIVLEGDGKASGEHARFTAKDGQYHVQDLGSTNGVLVNGHKVTEPVLLKNGAKVQIGMQLFQFTIQGKAQTSSGRTKPVSVESAKASDSAPLVAAPVDEAAIEAEDMTALTREVRGKGGGAKIIAALELLVVMVLFGGILVGAWMVMQARDKVTVGGEDSYPPSRAGGLLESNPSFDNVDDAGMPVGWRTRTSNTDVLELVEGARGGQFAMQISRFKASNEISYVLSDVIDVSDKQGVKASCYYTNPEIAGGRIGTAQVRVAFFEHKKAPEALAEIPVAAGAGAKEWALLEGAARVPNGAKVARVMLVYAGNPGSVAFDDVNVEATGEAKAWGLDKSAKLGNGFAWRINPFGSIELETDSGQTLLRGGRVLLTQADGRDDPLDALEWATKPPLVVEQDGTMQMQVVYFDPMAEHDLRLNVDFGRDGSKATLSAALSQTGNGNFDGASTKVALSMLALPAFVPSELIRFDGNSVMESSTEMGMGRDGRVPVLDRVIAADTARGNVISSDPKLDVRFRAWAFPAGRGLHFQRERSVSVAFELGTGRDEMNQMLLDLDSGDMLDDRIQRLDQAMDIIREFPFNREAFEAACNAIDSVSKYYRLRLLELRDGISVPELTQNEQLYKSAMREAITHQESLSDRRETLETKDIPMLRDLTASAYTSATVENATEALDALSSLLETVEKFDELAGNAQRSLFELEVRIEQREARPFVVSARDYLESGRPTQGLLKLRYVIDTWPRCPLGTEAKERMLDVAESLIDEGEQFKKDDLSNISAQRMDLAREMVELVESKLLRNLLSETQLMWLQKYQWGLEESAGDLVKREDDLIVRIRNLKRRLPATGN